MTKVVGISSMPHQAARIRDRQAGGNTGRTDQAMVSVTAVKIHDSSPAKTGGNMRVGVGAGPGTGLSEQTLGGLAGSVPE